MTSRGSLIAIGVIMTLVVIPAVGFGGTILAYHLNPKLPLLNKQSNTPIGVVVGVSAVATVVALVLSALFAIIYFSVALNSADHDTSSVFR